MPQDSGTRGAKALEDIARALSEQNKLLSKIEQNTRPRKAASRPAYLEPSDANPAGSESDSDQR